MGKLIPFLFLVGRYVSFSLLFSFSSLFIPNLCTLSPFHSPPLPCWLVPITLVNRKRGIPEKDDRANRQAKELDKLRKNRGKPLDGRPVPF
jgi:hypothetical protein